MRSKLTIGLMIVLTGALLMGTMHLFEEPDQNDYRAGGYGSYLEYVSGTVVSIDTKNRSFQMDTSGQGTKEHGDNLITIDCAILHSTETQITYDSISIGDAVTIGYLPPLNDPERAICITDIVKGDRTMDTRNSSFTRRNLIKMGVASAASAIALGGLAPLSAYASTGDKEFSSPKLSVLVKDARTGAIKTSYFQELGSPKPARALSGKIPVEISEFSKSHDGNASLYSIGTKIALNEGDYIEVSEEGDETLEVYAKVTLGVTWGNNHNTVQIQRGTFEVSSKSPLVSYSNTSYAMIQKGRYIADMFNGNTTTVETNWPPDPFDETTDAYTCGGAVIGGGFNMLTGDEFWFQIEIYL